MGSQKISKSIITKLNLGLHNTVNKAPKTAHGLDKISSGIFTSFPQVTNKKDYRIYLEIQCIIGGKEKLFLQREMSEL